jgi:hypothetical protein
MEDQLKYNNQNNMFGERVRAEVNNYFSSNNLKKTGDIRLHLKTVIFMCAEILLYVKLVFFTPESTLASLLLCGTLGLVLAGIGFNIMHDASHGSYSSIPWVNKIVALVLDQMGASSVLWKTKHVTIHHGLTNISPIQGANNSEAPKKRKRTRSRRKKREGASPETFLASQVIQPQAPRDGSLRNDDTISLR